MNPPADADALSPPRDDVASGPAVVDSKVPLVVGWGLIAAFVVALAAIGNYRAHVRLFQIAWLVGFCGYGLLIWRMHRAPDRGRAASGGGPSAQRRAYGWLIGFVLLRLTLVGTTPSDDLYRYMWEGKVQRHGVNPYVVPPDDPSLAELARNDPNWPHINHRDYPAIYPPLSQFACRAVSYLGDSRYVAKTVFGLLDVFVVVLLWLALRRCGVAPQWSLVYAACPLTLTAIAADGHLDSLMLVFVAAAIWAAAGGRWSLLGGCVGLAIASKLVAVVLLPWLFVRHWRAGLLAVAVAAITYLPFSDAGWHMFDGLRRFTGTTRVFGPIHGPAEWLVGPAWSRKVCGAALCAALAIFALRRRRFEDYARSAIIALTLLTPILHYWYLTWMLLVIGPRVRWWQVTLCAGFAFYFEAERQAYLTGAWSIPSWAPFYTFIPAAIVMAIEFVATNRGGKRCSPEHSAVSAAEQ